MEIEMTAVIRVDTPTGICIGQLVGTENGWRFVPWISGRKGSRKFYTSADQALPSWAKKMAAK
jgi:hypothetical protein